MFRAMPRKWVLVDKESISGPLYWSNQFGWVDDGSHDVFTDDERRAFRVCFGGQWQPADSIPTRNPDMTEQQTAYIVPVERMEVFSKGCLYAVDYLRCFEGEHDGWAYWVENTIYALFDSKESAKRHAERNGFAIATEDELREWIEES